MSVGYITSDNVTVTVESYTASQDASGGTSESYASTTTGVTGVFSQVAGNRDGSFRGENERGKATFSTETATVGNQRVRLKITAVADPALSALVNTYWRVDHCDGHPAGRGGLVKARYTCGLSRLEPAS